MHVADVTMFYGARGGGVRRYLHAKHRWLASRPGYRHTLVVPRRAAIPEPDADTIDVPSVPLPFTSGYRLPVAKRSAVRALAGVHPDVIEAGDPYRFAWAALDAGRSLGVPVVGFYHSDLPHVVARHYGQRAERLAQAYVRRLYSRFDLVLAPSASTVAKLRALGLQHVRFQPLGVDTSVFRPQRRSRVWREYLGIRPLQRLLVYVGRSAPEKNLAVLLGALDRLGPSYMLAVVGPTSLAHSSPNVRLVPYVNDAQQLAALLATADAFVHAGDQETFGVAALEAMACGIPVVAPNAGALAELVDDDVGLRVQPRDAGALAAGIEALFECDVAQLGAAARRRAERYDWNRVLPDIVRRYSALRTPQLHAS
jgi:alpha-1,6-mannosyltransferase